MTEPAVVDEAVVYHAVTEAYAPATKTAMDGLDVVWSEGDAVAVFAGQNLPDKYVLSAGAGETSADFTLLEENAEVWGENAFNAAYYPYDETAFLQDMYDGLPYICVVTPNVQPYVEGNFADGAFPMAAATASVNDKDFSFKNVFGLMKLQLKGTKTVKTVTVSGGASEPLAGNSLISFENGLPSVLIADYPTYTSVSVDCGEGVTLKADEATEFYVALPPTEFEAGFTVTVVDVDNKQYKVTAPASEKNVIERSKILVMPAVDVDAIVSPVDFAVVPSLTDAELDITLNEATATGFYGIFASAENWAGYSSMFNVPEYFEMLITGQLGDMGVPCYLYTGKTFSGNLSEFGWSELYMEYGYKNMVAPGSTSVVVIIPVSEGKTEYSMSDAIVYEVNTTELTVGGEVALPEYEVVSGYTKFAVEFAGSDNVTYAVFGFFGPDQTLPTEENCLEEMQQNPTFGPDGSFTLENQLSWGELPGTVYKLCILLVGQDGSAQLHTIDVPTKELPYDDALEVTVEDEYYDVNEQKVYAYVTEWPEDAELWYAFDQSAAYSDEYAVASAIEAALTGDGYTSYKKVDMETALVDGEVVLSVAVKQNTYSVQKRYLHVFAKTADGKISRVVTSTKVEIPIKEEAAN